jgi:hypothetical protein
MWMKISEYVVYMEVQTLWNKETEMRNAFEMQEAFRGLREQFASVYDKTEKDFVKIKFCV